MMSHRLQVMCFLKNAPFRYFFFFLSVYFLSLTHMPSHNEWTILEKLLLTQAVYKYGENMWFQVARVIKQHDLIQLQNIERTPDFYSQKVSVSRIVNVLGR